MLLIGGGCGWGWRGRRVLQGLSRASGTLVGGTGDKDPGARRGRRWLGCIRDFPLRARLDVSVAPFPVPATSHAA